MRYNILSLSGGGYMGLYTAHVLAHLEDRSGRPLRESFDLIAGTSVGGIIGLGIALGVPARKIVRAFEENGTKIFSDRSAPRNVGQAAIDAFRFFSGAKYKSLPLRKTIEEICGPRTSMGAVSTPFIAPALNLTTGRPEVFRTQRLRGYRDWSREPAVHIALATSAAPTLFPLVEIQDEIFCDGGVFANSPDLIALHEAETVLGLNPNHVHVLSIGTATGHYGLSRPKNPSFGILEWMEDQALLRVFLSSQQSAAEHLMTGRLQDRYLRVDTAQGIHTNSLGLDVATAEARKTLSNLASGTVSSIKGSGCIEDFLRHDAGSYRPL